MPTQDLELGFLAHPDAPAPGVVVVPDVWGLSDHYRDLARRLAGAGFAALSVDLYRRERPSLASVQEALEWIRGLSDPQVLADVQEAIDLLAAHDAVGGRAVGVTGFCMGGQYALLAACSCRGLSAAVAFYGMLAYADDLDPQRKPRSPLAALPDRSCPLLGLYGEEDALIPLAHVRQLEAGLKAVPRAGEVVTYPGAGHAFVNDTRPESYRPEAAADAWARMLAFFREHLA